MKHIFTRLTSSQDATEDGMQQHLAVVRRTIYFYLTYLSFSNSYTLASRPLYLMADIRHGTPSCDSQHSELVFRQGTDRFWRWEIHAICVACVTIRHVTAIGSCGKETVRKESHSAFIHICSMVMILSSIFSLIKLNSTIPLVATIIFLCLKHL